MAVGGGEALWGACGVGPCSSLLCASLQVCLPIIQVGGRAARAQRPPPLFPNTAQTPAVAWGPWICGHRPPTPASPAQGLVPGG